MGPMSSRGRIIGQGNLVEAKAMLKKAGNVIAASQRMVFHFRSFFLSLFFIFWLCWFCSLVGRCENAALPGQRRLACRGTDSRSWLGATG